MKFSVSCILAHNLRMYMLILFCCFISPYFSADVNECMMENDCHNMSQCFNTQGSYNCTCNQGYTGNGTDCAGTFICS